MISSVLSPFLHTILFQAELRRQLAQSHANEQYLKGQLSHALAASQSVVQTPDAQREYLELQQRHTELMATVQQLNLKVAEQEAVRQVVAATAANAQELTTARDEPVIPTADAGAIEIELPSADVANTPVGAGRQDRTPRRIF